MPCAGERGACKKWKMVLSRYLPKPIIHFPTGNAICTRTENNGSPNDIRDNSWQYVFSRLLPCLYACYISKSMGFLYCTGQHSIS